MATRVLDQFKGCMLGALVGDCLGAHFECRYENMVPRDKIDAFFDGLKTEPKKQKYTDDSAMARQIAESFIECKSFNYKDIATRFSEEFYRGPWRGYGGSVIEVFAKLKKDPSQPFQPASEQFNGSGSYGNGAGMRAHPIALGSYQLGINDTMLHATSIAKITHAHRLGVGGGVLQTLAVHQVLKGASPTRLLQTLQDEMASFEREEEEREYADKLKKIEKWRDEPDSNLPVLLPELGNDVSAIDSVPTALFCFLRGCSKFDKSVQFEETIKLAIQLGGDTDTIASMAGAITGAYLGAESIPEYMLASCEAVDQVRQAAEDIYNLVIKDGEESLRRKAEVDSEEPEGKKAKNGDDL